MSEDINFDCLQGVKDLPKRISDLKRIKCLIVELEWFQFLKNSHLAGLLHILSFLVSKTLLCDSGEEK